MDFAAQGGKPVPGGQRPGQRASGTEAVGRDGGCSTERWDGQGRLWGLIPVVSPFPGTRNGLGISHEILGMVGSRIALTESTQRASVRWSRSELNFWVNLTTPGWAQAWHKSGGFWAARVQVLGDSCASSNVLQNLRPFPVRPQGPVFGGSESAA